MKKIIWSTLSHSKTSLLILLMKAEVNFQNLAAIKADDKHFQTEKSTLSACGHRALLQAKSSTTVPAARSAKSIHGT